MDQTIVVTVHAVHPTATCPCCQQPSSSIHSRYIRTFADLPWAMQTVRISAQVRKFFCRNSACVRTIFTERLPHLAPPYARRTTQLATEQRHLALAHGGEAAARMAKRHGMPLSPRTLLRLVRRAPAPTAPPPRIIGVDDFAFRKRQTYGTLLVDLQRRTPIDMLADRSSETLAAWLQYHPSVDVISRDRALEYADGALRGAPQAIQVADRFHLVQNTREVVQRVVERHHTALRGALTIPADDGGRPDVSP